MGRRRPAMPRRILVLHRLLLGDTLMVTALLAKLRARFPAADIVMTVAPAYAPLYAGHPYGVTVLPLDPRDIGTFWPLLFAPRFDLAILPADNRWSWLARAIGARWIVGIAGDRPAHKNWPVDELVPYSTAPTAYGDTAAELVPGPPPAPYRIDDWPPPPNDGSLRLDDPYAVLHVGASSQLKLWPADRWRALAAALEAAGLTVVWSAGPGETAILDAIDPGPPPGRPKAAPLRGGRRRRLRGRGRRRAAPRRRPLRGGRRRRLGDLHAAAHRWNAFVTRVVACRCRRAIARVSRHRHRAPRTRRRRADRLRCSVPDRR